MLSPSSPAAVGPDDDAGGAQKDRDDVIVVPRFGTSASASYTCTAASVLA
jgi:hypothetical protein